MPRPRAVVLGATGAIATVAVLGWMLTGGSLLSVGHHRWKVAITPDAPGTWHVDLPALLDDGSPIAKGSLEDLLSRLGAEGRGSFVLIEGTLRVEGDGPVEVSATRTFAGWNVLTPVSDREAFSRWSAGGTNATRTAPSEPTLDLTWSIDFSGGGGHTCWSSDAWSATVPAGETVQLFAPDRAGRPWGVLCA